MNNLILGRKGEALAENYLKKKGYKFICRNYCVKGGEIDLIFALPIKVQIKELDEDISQGKIKRELRENIIKNMQNILVFVEVKTRSNDKFGKPYEAVGYFKEKHLRTAANKFMQENDLQNASIRYDCVSVDGDKIEHIKDMF